MIQSLKARFTTKNKKINEKSNVTIQIKAGEVAQQAQALPHQLGDLSSILRTHVEGPTPQSCPLTSTQAQ